MINMVSVYPESGKTSMRGALHLSKKAARFCLSESGINSSGIDMLLYSGIYRDDHIGEPSIASLIQKEIGANPDLYPLDSRTFSLDVQNGACGVINAMQILDGFIRSGKISTGMIISADSEPFRGLSDFYNFRAAASAIILSKSDDNRGFELIKTYAYPEFKDSFRSYISWQKRKGRIRNKNVLVVNQSDNYLNECLECTKRSLDDFMESSGLTPGDIDLVIPSQSPTGFSRRLGEIFGLEEKIVSVEKLPKGEYHTAGPGFALRKAWDDGSFEKSRNILFVTVGSGISNAIALYKAQGSRLKTED